MTRLARLARRLRREERGITLPELLIGMVISSLVLGATVSTVVALGHGQSDRQKLSDAQDQARFAVSALSRQLRNLASPTPDQPQAVDRAQGDDFVFQTVDPVGPNSGANKVNVRRLRYCVGSSDRSKLYLQSQTWTTNTVPAVPSGSGCPASGWNTTRQVAASLSNYANGNSRSLFAFNSTDLTSITRVEAEAWIDPDPAKRPAEVPLRTAVTLRNQNRKPVAAFDITLSVGAHVILNGSRSVDPEGQPLTYVWYDNGTKITGCTGVICDYNLPTSGAHDLQLFVYDPAKLEAVASAPYTVSS